MFSHQFLCNATTSLRNQAFTRGHIWPIIIPARLTWLLQPLDVHVFARLKAAVRTAVVQALLESHAGELSNAAVLQTTTTITESFLRSQSWAPCFGKTGFGHVQRLVSPMILRAVGLDEPPQLGNAAPSLHHLQLCFPQRAAVPVRPLFAPFLPFLPVPAAAPLPLAAAPAPRARAAPLFPIVPSEGPVTRSWTRLTRAAVPDSSSALSASHAHPARPPPSAASSSHGKAPGRQPAFKSIRLKMPTL